jgi:hypothetical protein
MSGIRLGDIPDMDAICDLATELQGQSLYDGIEPDPTKFKMLVANMMGDKTSRVILIVDDDDKAQGFMLGMVEEFFFSRRRYATDIAVYVRKGYRHLAPSMYRKFIDWAITKPRVDRIMFGLSSGIGNPNRVGEMFVNSFGMMSCGGIYMKEVKPCQA